MVLVPMAVMLTAVGLVGPLELVICLALLTAAGWLALRQVGRRLGHCLAVDS